MTLSRRSQRTAGHALPVGRSTRVIAWTAIATAATASAAIATAMAMYPGGTGANPRSNGHAFWENVLCDLAQPTAFNGMSNASARPFAQLGTVALFLAGMLAGLLAPVVLEDARAAAKCRTFGVSSGIIAMFLPVFPSELHPLMHSVVVMFAGPLALLSLFYWVSATRRSSWVSQGVRWLTVFLASTTFLAFFAWIGWFLRMAIERHPESDTAFPATLVAPAQRLALLGLIVWTVTVAHAALRRTRRDT